MINPEHLFKHLRPKKLSWRTAFVLFWFSAPVCVLLCLIEPRERKIRNEASSCPGIFSKTLRFYYVASSPGSPLPHLLDGHRKLVGRSVITVFGKHCKCIAQKCTHLGRLPPLVSHLLLLRHCVLTWYRGKKKSHQENGA